MLKRQRVSSPPPACPSVPQDTPAEDVIDIRDLKRRRVIPPSLDGQTRGWDSSNPTPLDDDNEEECIEVDAQDGGCGAKIAQSPNAEYKSVNSVLKEIHILHKHRQLFMPPTNQPLLSSLDARYPAVRSPSVKVQNTYPYDEPTHASGEESARVYEHYEGTNRFLASAFLSRRQGNYRP